MTTRVLLMGTEACGKTILLAVMAHKYRAFTEDGYFLEAMNAEANAFTNRNWELLVSQGEWPPATPPGALHGFVWQLHHRAPVAGDDVVPATELLVDLTMADFAGEVFRKAFGKGDTSSAEAAQLMSFVDQTDGIVCLVNLKDIIDEQDVERRSETEWAIKNLIDHATDRMGIPVLLAFTQTDRYEALLEGRDARSVVQHYMPQVAGAHPHVAVQFVAAVDTTTLASGSDGLVMEKPAKDFGSKGVAELLEWISKVRARPRPSPVPPTSLRQFAKLPLKILGTRKAKFLSLIMLILLALWSLFGLIPASETPAPRAVAKEAPRPPPVPVTIFSGTNTWSWNDTRWVIVVNDSSLPLTIAAQADYNEPRPPEYLDGNCHVDFGRTLDSWTLKRGYRVLVSANGYEPKLYTIP